MHNKYIFLDWNGRRPRHTVTSLSSFDSCNGFFYIWNERLPSVITPRSLHQKPYASLVWCHSSSFSNKFLSLYWPCFLCTCGHALTTFTLSLFLSFGINTYLYSMELSFWNTHLFPYPASSPSVSALPSAILFQSQCRLLFKIILGLGKSTGDCLLANMSLWTWSPVP